MNTILDTWYDVYAHALFGKAVRAGLVYDLMFKAVGLVLLAPAGAWVLQRLIAASGAVSVTNEAIAGFLLSLPGVAFLLLAVALSLASFYAEQAGLMHVAASVSRAKAPDWRDALATALGALPRLLHLALWQVGILLLWLLPLVAVAAVVYTTLLGAHDINWYLDQRPPEFMAALVIGAVLVTVAAVVVIRFMVAWGISIPLCLYERICARAALRRSAELLRGRRWRAFRLVVLNLLLALALSAAVLWLADAGLGALLRLLDGPRALVSATAVAVVLLAALATLLSFGVLAVLAASIMHLYLGIMNVDGLPADRWNRAARSARVPRWVIVGALLALVLAAGSLAAHTLSDLRLGRETLVTAHRGSSVEAPENTLAALYQAIADGADVAEIDVQETADGALVLLHDKDLMRMAGSPAKVWETNLADLQRVDIGRRFGPEYTGERITTLSEALKVAGRHLALNIELKYNGHDQQLAERVVAAVRDAGCGERCIITSLNQDGLVRVRALAPEIRIGQIVTAALGNARRLDVDLLSMNQAHVTPTVVRANRRAGLETHVWTVNTEADMARMLDYGVDAIITDRPAELRELIDARAELGDGELLLLALGRKLRE
ncbi:glycerophosphodiester phosphodiesterase family protein [uncultured Thiohalocapsa sp.]|uniref:glycerophosphodiester phosphodiesterase n=1 Tax=uncultured Thiohalocapsa sp. TaxID=768990 RepID=UPI0025CE5DF2|nr:glycerophosphodiester phosphodiesterase family protein [uncultured Thiohalocapsa sp.]